MHDLNIIWSGNKWTVSMYCQCQRALEQPLSLLLVIKDKKKNNNNNSKEQLYILVNSHSVFTFFFSKKKVNMRLEEKIDFTLISIKYEAMASSWLALHSIKAGNREPASLALSECNKIHLAAALKLTN